MGTVLRYHLLGPIEVVRDSRPVELGAPKQRTVLAVLLLGAGRVVSTDRIVETVWGENAPPSVQAGVQAYISNLRRLLRDDTRATSPIVRRAPGYVIEVEPDEPDLTAFLRDADAAQAALDAGDWAAAAAAAEQGLARWRGPLIAEHARGARR
jgi:DNA-binding SARP family transcriptional activator